MKHSQVPRSLAEIERLPVRERVQQAAALFERTLKRLPLNFEPFSERPARRSTLGVLVHAHLDKLGRHGAVKFAVWVRNDIVHEEGESQEQDWEFASCEFCRAVQEILSFCDDEWRSLVLRPAPAASPSDPIAQAPHTTSTLKSQLSGTRTGATYYLSDAATAAKPSSTRAPKGPGRAPSISTSGTPKHGSEPPLPTLVPSSPDVDGEPRVPSHILTAAQPYFEPPPKGEVMRVDYITLSADKTYMIVGNKNIRGVVPVDEPTYRWMINADECSATNIPVIVEDNGTVEVRPLMVRAGLSPQPERFIRLSYRKARHIQTWQELTSDIARYRRLLGVLLIELDGAWIIDLGGGVKALLPDSNVIIYPPPPGPIPSSQFKKLHLRPEYIPISDQLPTVGCHTYIRITRIFEDRGIVLVENVTPF